MKHLEITSNLNETGLLGEDKSVDRSFLLYINDVNLKT